ncbi:hypothetical protein EAVNNN508_03517 [Elizabethkingia anophelis]|nr:hypothetical protein EAVNVB490_00719 [Elizabethkingia anophelis]CAI9669552.1 hypothetical protein EAVNNN508_00719 [Elizabethkingia anophelis]CAI9676109.1 hypothetical protein EAVNVB490_03519 [Elizabethkingia anophelis]CAI9686847.1 hypothetical protein EAVNNN508_03517 [Elizabethkingia anophelis]
MEVFFLLTKATQHNSLALKRKLQREIKQLENTFVLNLENKTA